MGSTLKVSLVRHTENVEKLIAMAAKLCYSKVGVDEIGDNLTDEEIKKFINKLMNIGHESPIEHTSFTFAVEGVSRTLTHQLVRHRIASFSQQSQRYVKLDQFEYVIPPNIDKSPVAREIFIKSMEASQIAYDDIVNILVEKYKNTYMTYHEIDVVDLIPKDELSKIEKRAIEDARYVFPNACESKIILTMNARSLFNFFSQRCCNRAQWEIRNLANEMYKLALPVAPTLFKYSGPECLFGKCPEGSMSCGIKPLMKLL